MMLGSDGRESRSAWGRPERWVASFSRRWGALNAEALALRVAAEEARTLFSGLEVPRPIRVRNPGASTAETSVRARGPPQEVSRSEHETERNRGAGVRCLHPEGRWSYRWKAARVPRRGKMGSAGGYFFQVPASIGRKAAGVAAPGLLFSVDRAVRVAAGISSAGRGPPAGPKDSQVPLRERCSTPGLL